MLVDSHCHLNFPDFENKIADVVRRASDMDVKYMQTICTKLGEFPQILDIANDYDNIWCSVGVHPNNVAEEELTNAEELIKLARDNKVIGIGETGLDYYYEHSPREKQQKSFREHLKASAETGLPVIVHTRDADDDTLRIMQEQYAIKQFTGLIHCFSTGSKLAYGAIELGMYISISGIVTFKKATALQEIVKELPIEKMLVETDAPYLAPTPHRGKTNEPGFTRHTAQFIAELKGVPYDEVAKKTTANFFELFSKAKP
ncbi:MAG: LuxR family transcriptional regulator [Alphaproteobacteria bacterium CG11_big_fil_rev_8_21_14_0_20_39_49]|nr:MAG: LuxR family transcriptional regulator [Alphaproteobacteria bacterium CG11_big_fil_rev_8_21_14_0_20_39_49]